MLTTILLLNPVYVTFFWAVVLHLNRRRKDEPRLFLGKFMILAFVIYLSHFFYFHELYDAYIWLDCFYNFASLSVYPAYFIYVLLLTRDDRFSLRKHGRYFIAPAIIFVAMAIGYIVMNDEQEAMYIREVIYGKLGGTGIMRYMNVVSITEKLVFVTQILIYLFLSFREIRTHTKQLLNSYSFTENRSLLWVQVMNITFFLTSLASIAIAIIGRERFLENSGMLLFPSVIFSVMLFTIGLLGNTQKAVLLEKYDSMDHTGEEDERIPARLKNELVALFEADHLHLNKDLTIWDLTGKLGTNRTYVSKIINNEFGLNFASYVNYHRVIHAKKLLHENRQIITDELAELSGFGSVASLYRAFLAAEKVSLPQYRRNLRNSKPRNLPSAG
jgi:AraC-like DNA-binding protein